MVLAQTMGLVRAHPAQSIPLGQPFLGPAGIDAQVLHQSPYDLLGRKIAIGQVEPGRPGLFGYDKNVAVGVGGLRLAGLFFRDRPVKPNRFVDAHAHGVASFMVGQGKTVRGVAPAARLYSGAMGSRQFRGGQAEECLTIAHVAQQNGGDVRAINLSFGESLRLDKRDRPVLDGNALLTQCVDWLTQKYDTLFVVAGNQGKGGIPIPTDHYNGVTVAYTKATVNPVQDSPYQRIYNKVDFANLGDELPGVAHRFIGKERNLNQRSSVSLVAPGRKLKALLLNGGERVLSGTSFAAPQITGGVALLQEYGDRRINSLLEQHGAVPTDAPWSLDARRHEVMKAVLLNASDKLRERDSLTRIGDRLGMTKTIVGQTNKDWLASRAHYSQTMPLDPLFGAGQLNLRRAHQQFSAGQYSPDAMDIPRRGWDYNNVGLGADLNNLSTYRDYSISQPLQRGSYLAVTLAWDRKVELIDNDDSGEYSLGDRFRDRGLNNLDLYLMAEDETSTRRSVWASTSSVDSVEHLFHRIPKTGRYKLRVQYSQQVNTPSQNYAIAWWGASPSR